MSQATSELKKMPLDEKEREIYEARRMAILDAETRISYSYRKGIKEGEIKGEIKGKKEGLKEGEIKGKIEGIESILEIRFGARGLHRMAQIRAIENLETLNQIFVLAKSCKTIEDWEKELDSCL